jgi:hypothetical protein
MRNYRIMQLRSMPLDSGIHARITGLKIVTSTNKYLLKIVNTFTVSVVVGTKTPLIIPAANWLCHRVRLRE